MASPSNKKRTLFRSSAIALALAAAVSSTAALGAPQIAIRFYDDNRLAQGPALSTRSHAELERAAGLALTPHGRDADGAFRFGFALQPSNGQLRSALNNIRASGAVVYADSVAGPSTAASIDQPVTSFIVVMRPLAKRAGADVATRTRLAQKMGSAIAKTRAMSGGSELLELETPLNASQAHAAIAKLAADPDVAHVEINRRAQVSALPSDPMLSQQWNLIDAAGGINAPLAWEFTTGDQFVRVAVLDTGMTAHPDLAQRVIGGYDFVADARFANDGDGRDADPSDSGDWVTSEESAAVGGAFQGCAVTNSTWHGTMVAGTLGAAANGAGVSGVTWLSPIVNVRVLGKCGGALSDVADGLRWAAGIAVPGVPDNPAPARIINLSMAGPGPCGAILQSAVTDALSKGAVLVAAAGNGNDDVGNHWPANCAGVIPVAATSKNGSRAFYSSHGSLISLSAPGGGFGGSIPIIRNTSATTPDPDGHIYGQQVGSSLAASLVSGALSLALSLDRDATAAELRALLEKTARQFPGVASDQCTSAICGAGILDAGAALQELRTQVGSGVTPSAPPSPPPAAQPSPATASEAPPPMPVPVAGGWRAKSPEITRLRKESAQTAVENARRGTTSAAVQR
ncbi:MAG TPA: S8 family peptidase [Casimicrobiaceae bacterium]|nr:S8 family peptidase [Casimicrobiaceae bacterium]